MCQLKFYCKTNIAVMAHRCIYEQRLYFFSTKIIINDKLIYAEDSISLLTGPKIIIQKFVHLVGFLCFKIPNDFKDKNFSISLIFFNLTLQNTFILIEHSDFFF